MIISPLSISEFRNIDSASRAERPNIFQLAVSDEHATDEALADVEAQVGIRLPISYREFLKGYGGGDFGFINIFSADRASEWYLPAMQATASDYLPEGLLAFSDDSMGGYYVLKVLDGMAEESVHYWNPDGGLIDTEFPNILAFIARYAYQPA